LLSTKIPFRISREEALCYDVTKKVLTLNVTYISPSGERFSDIQSLCKFLREKNFKICVKYFTFEAGVNCLQTLKVTSEDILLQDFSNGKEMLNLSVLKPSVESVEMPKIKEYISSYCRTPTVSKNFNKRFLTCCECLYDCEVSRPKNYAIKI